MSVTHRIDKYADNFPADLKQVVNHFTRCTLLFWFVLVCGGGYGCAGNLGFFFFLAGDDLVIGHLSDFCRMRRFISSIPFFLLFVQCELLNG